MPIAEYKERLNERIQYCVNHIEPMKGFISRSMDRAISIQIGKIVWGVAKSKFDKYSKTNEADVEEFLDTNLTFSEEDAFNLPDNYIAVKNPHEFFLLMSECEKVAVNGNGKTAEKSIEHELNHWLPLLESSDAKAIFGVRFEKFDNGPVEYVPFVIPYSEFTVRSFLATLRGTEKIDDMSVMDKLKAAEILNAVRKAGGDSQKISDAVSKIFNA